MSAESESRDYIRRFYGLPFLKRGTRLLFRGHGGTVTGFRNQYLLVRLDGEDFRRRPTVLHPTWEVQYPDAGDSS